MTELEHDTNDNSEAIASLDFHDIKKFAKLMGIKASREWTKEDYIAAVVAKQKANDVQVVLDANAPAPGYSRIILHRDPTPKAKNNPVHVGVNGRLNQIPRGIEVDIPTEMVEILQNARSKTLTEVDGPGGKPTFVETETISYPYQLIATTPGKSHNRYDNRAESFKIKLQCKEAIKKWPTDGELKEWLKHRMKYN